MRIVSVFIFASILFYANVAAAQELKIKNNRSGLFSLGGRSTLSAFNGGVQSNSGIGLGGQFRIQLAERVNTDWFFDYITGNTGTFAARTDYHIGWSVLFYLRNKPADKQKIQPYVLVGHCFDYTFLRANNDRSNFSERWSSAIQGGLGTHFNLSPRFDISTVIQYMMHMGTDIHAVKHTDGHVHFHHEKGAALEGHLLFHVSLNYKIADLW